VPRHGLGQPEEPEPMRAEPHTPPGVLTPTQAAEIAGRARRLLRAGRLTHHDYAVLDGMLWCSRKPGADSTIASYTRLQKLANVARATVAGAIGRLVALGLVQRVKRRVLVLWHNGGRAWRQLANEYRFHCEFSARSDSEKKEFSISLAEPSSTEQRAAEAALAARRAVILARIAGTTPAPTT
jgi:hypothetical protein